MNIGGYIYLCMAMEKFQRVLSPNQKKFYEDIMLRVFFLVEKFRFKFMYSDVITSWSEEEFVNQFESSQIKCIIKFVLQKFFHTQHKTYSEKGEIENHFGKTKLIDQKLHKQ